MNRELEPTPYTTCATCGRQVLFGTLAEGLHVQLASARRRGSSLSSTLLEEDGTPHRYACPPYARHFRNETHPDWCGFCKQDVNCDTTSDHQGTVHRCTLCGNRTYVEGQSNLRQRRLA